MYALVVDDSAAMRHHLSRTLQGLGWQVGTAVNGNNAMQVLGGIPHCDLVLTDWHMPDMDGMQLCRAIRKDPRHRSTRIVMVTSDAVMGSVSQALDAGASDIIMKPFTKESLQERLATVMSS